MNESDTLGHDYLYEKIVRLAKEKGLAGATVIKGIESFGSSSPIHKARLIELSEALPVVIDIIDSEEKIHSFVPFVTELFDQCGGGGLVITLQADVLYHQSKK